MKGFWLIMLMGFLGSSQAADVNICTDENFWYPFTFQEKGDAKGVHIEIVKKALERSSLSYRFTPLPWKRCLNAAKYGQYDAVISASFKENRAQYLYYPEGAKTTKTSPFRISQVEYVVVSMADDSYEYNKELSSLPSPVRATKGYSIVDDLKREGIKVDTARDDVKNLRKLLRDKKGVVITLGEIARFMAEQERFKGQFKIHPVPIKSKSYYMPFSHLSKITKQQRYEIWKNIANVRNDNQQVLRIIKQLTETLKTKSGAYYSEFKAP